MSARLGMNEIAYKSWKQQTFTQITSKLQKNKISTSSGSSTIFGPRPLPIYRREIATATTSKCRGNPRVSARVNMFEQPGGYLVNMANGTTTDKTGVESILDKQTVKTVNQLNEKYCNSGTNPSKCLSTQNNALRRMRSSGMIKHNYYPTTNQYLYSRKETFDQNQFNYVRAGDPNAIPGSPASFQNTYTSGGGVFDTRVNGSMLKCPVTYKPNNYNYSQNGAVESSTRIDRLRYNTLNTVSASYKGAYGAAMADSLAYNVPYSGYNTKEIIGYSTIAHPVVMKDGTVRKCGFRRVRR